MAAWAVLPFPSTVPAAPWASSWVALDLAGSQPCRRQHYPENTRGLGSMVCGLGGLLRQPVLYKLTAPEMQTPGLPGARSPAWRFLVLLPIRFWTPDTLRPTSLPASSEVTTAPTAPTEDLSLNIGDPPRSAHPLAVICIPARHTSFRKKWLPSHWALKPLSGCKLTLEVFFFFSRNYFSWHACNIQ